MIYCVEDDAGIRELVVYTLRNTGFEADGFEDGAALTTALKKCKPQLILLDIMLPGEDGITILRRLRAAPDTAKIPVILLTAKNTEYDKVVGLDTGADDYIPKPFGMMELIARIRAVLRRTEEAKQVQLLAATVEENLQNLEAEFTRLTTRTGGEEGKLQTLKDQLRQQTDAQSALAQQEAALDAEQSSISARQQQSADEMTRLRLQTAAIASIVLPVV